MRIRFEGLRLVKRTTAKGNFQVKHFEPATYRATLSLEGFEDRVVDLYIVDGIRFDVVMERVSVEV